MFCFAKDQNFNVHDKKSSFISSSDVASFQSEEKENILDKFVS